MITIWQFLVWKDPMCRAVSHMHTGLEEPAVSILQSATFHIRNLSWLCGVWVCVGRTEGALRSTVGCIHGVLLTGNSTSHESPSELVSFAPTFPV